MKFKTPLNKPRILGLKVARWLLFLFVMLDAYSALAQPQSDYTLTWDVNTGCQFYSPPKPLEGEDSGLFIDDIQLSDCVKVCEGASVIYTLTGDLSGNPNVQWTVVGGTTGTVVNSTTTSSIPVTWGVAGLASITFSMNTLMGGTITKTLCIEIVEKPHAEFLAYPMENNGVTKPVIYACVGQPISFTDTSTTNGGSPIAAHYWTFGDQTFTAVQNPTHIYNETGEYLVELIITNSCGCQASVKRYVVIQAAGGYEISCASAVCEGQTSTYSLPFVGKIICDEYNFEVQGGEMVNPNDGTVTVTWNHVNASGFGIVTFNPNGNCDLECLIPTSIRIPVIQTKGTITGNATICFGQQERYQLPQWPATNFQWSIQGNTPNNSLGLLIQTDQPNEVIFQPNHAGTFVLICNYQNTFLHCGGTASYTIKVKATEIINGATNLCSGSTGNYLTASTNNVNWTLTRNNLVVSGGTALNTSSFNFNFIVEGNYSLTVSGPEICDNQTISITVNPIPAAVQLATISQPTGLICPSALYTYTVSPSNSAMDYTWSCSGGTIVGSANDTEVTVNFNQTGPYSLHLTQQIKGQPNCISPVLNIPVAVFTIDAGISDNGTTHALISNNLSSCANTVKTYYAVNSTGSAGQYTIGDTYTWSIIPSTAGSITTGQGTQTVSVLWNNSIVPATAQLVLQITKCTRNSTFTKNVDITPQRRLTVTANNGCSGNLITMTVSSNAVIPVGTVITWDYGDGNYTTQTVTVAATSFTKGYVYFTNPSGPANFLISVSLAVPSSENCSGEMSQTTTVTITPGPIADVSMTGTGNTFCSASDIDTVLIAANAGSGVVKWYKYPNIYLVTSSTFNVSTYGPGTYFYTITLGGCTSKSDLTTISVVSCEPPITCSVLPSPNLNLTSTGTCGPLSLQATANFAPVAGYPSLWTIVGPDADADIMGHHGVGSELYNYSTPIAAAGVYHITYKAAYICTNGQVAFDATSLNVTIPYLPSFTTKVNCGATPGSTYSVALNSTSSFMATLPLANRNYFYFWSHTSTGPWTAINASSAPTTTFNQPVGDSNGAYYFKLVVSETTNAYAPCEKISDNVNLAPDSVRDITVEFYHCYNDAIKFGLSGLTVPNETYLWTFDTLSGLPLATNTLEKPTRVFDELASGLAHNVTVTVDITNKYGCVRRETQTILIPARCYYGDISTATASICKGGSLVLHYTAGSHADNCAISQYQWMEGTTQIGTSAAPSYTVTNVSGTKFYWVRLVNASGCSYNCAGRISPNYKPMPTLQLSAPSIMCYSGGTATATVGANTSLQWYVDGVLQLNTNTSLSLGSFAVGSHTLSAVATLNNGCSKTVAQSFTIKTPPEAPTVSFEIDCVTYKVTLSATPPAGGTGTLTWSSGTIGNPTVVFQGGPYMVTYNDGSGCLSYAQLDVPNSLDKYLWIFPSGCYTQCDNNPGTLIGPNVTVPEWNWMHEDHPETSGHGLVQPYQPMQSGAYTLALNNGYCAQETAPMNLNLIRCSECKLDKLETEIKCIEGELFPYRMTLYIGNPGASVLTTISAPDNQVIVSPTAFTLDSGANMLSFNIIPINGFTTGVVHFILTSTNAQGEICTNEFDVKLISCKDPRKEGKNGIIVATTNSLLLYPNPAHGEVTAQFDLSSDAAEIFIYDLTGKQLASYAALNKKGSINLNIAALASGVYVVVLKENGQTTMQKKLVVE